jgi:hypothetical protein
LERRKFRNRDVGAIDCTLNLQFIVATNSCNIKKKLHFPMNKEIDSMHTLVDITTNPYFNNSGILIPNVLFGE